MAEVCAMHLSIEFSLAAALALILYFVAGKNNLALNVLLLLALFGFLLHPVLACIIHEGAGV